MYTKNPWIADPWFVCMYADPKTVDNKHKTVEREDKILCFVAVISISKYVPIYGFYEVKILLWWVILLEVYFLLGLFKMFCGTSYYL